MNGYKKHKKLSILCLLIFSASSFASSNPASTNYVDSAIQTALEQARSQSTYTAGTAISILNNVISGNYVAGTSNSIIVDNTNGTITGNYTAPSGSGINIIGNVISGAYTGGTGIRIAADVIIGDYASGTGVTVNNTTGTISGAYVGGTGITVDNTTGTIRETETVVIGQQAEGGYVFWLDSTGRHGLIAAAADVITTTGTPTTIVICNNTASQTATGNGIGSGAINTAAFLAKANAGSTPLQTAIGLTSSYSADEDGISTIPGCVYPPATGNPNPTPTCYGGWYLGSPAEMRLLNASALEAAPHVGYTPLDFTNPPEIYWTSTVVGGNVNNAYVMDLNGTLYTDQNIATGEARARAIRQF